MSQPGAYHLSLYRGDSYAWRFTLWADESSTVPVDLTGATVAAEIRDRSGGDRIVDLGVAVTVPNIVDMTMTPADYVDCPTQGVWDLQITYPDTSVRTVLGGSVTVAPDVTDSVALPSRRR